MGGGPPTLSREIGGDGMVPLNICRCCMLLLMAQQLLKCDVAAAAIAGEAAAAAVVAVAVITNDPGDTAAAVEGVSLLPLVPRCHRLSSKLLVSNSQNVTTPNNAKSGRQP